MLGNIKTKIFGAETSWAQAALYTAIGAAVTGALYYNYQHADEIAKKINKGWMHTLKMLTRHKGPLYYFAQDLMNLRQINMFVQKAEQDYRDNPTDENRDRLRHIAILEYQISDKINMRYLQFNPEQQQKADQLVEKIIK